jgi:hypothetical protein
LRDTNVDLVGDAELLVFLLALRLEVVAGVGLLAVNVTGPGAGYGRAYFGSANIDRCVMPS